MSTTVVNLNHRPKPYYDIYVGREGKGQSGYFGNVHTPSFSGDCRHCYRKYRVKTFHLEDDALALFERETIQRIIDDEEFREGLFRLRDCVLGCFCVRRDGTGKCHAKFYARWLDALPAVGASPWDLLFFARAELARLTAAAVEAADGE